ncbi:MAG TPA: S-methyl-5'-thioadenosine phosphorylase [Candidatus Nanoarchaeia archaeon]|nr:S-methyl-5'-thioadenosine phosphorylase [Candidatus Nanoarchaeia archaeon]
MAKIGIIGGSGLDDPKMLQDSHELTVSTPYGAPSSPLTVGRLHGAEVVILARHGRGHTITPSKVNNKANIASLKAQGVTHILATTACGSLREEIGRGHFVVLDQFIDFTRHRQVTHHDDFTKGIVHPSMPDPFDSRLRQALIAASQQLGFPTHERGTVVTIEGPRFSTRAESHMFRQWGADVINMSTAPECILANEMGMPYAAIAMSTDYDCWKTGEQPVTWEEVLAVFKRNAENVKRVLSEAVRGLQ